MKTLSRQRRPGVTNSRRRGSMFPIFVVALVVLAALTGSLIKTTLLQRKRVKADTVAAQADWLAISGLDRATARLAANAEFTGDEWNINRDQLGGQHAATVTSKVAVVPDSDTQKQITVQVQYATESEFQARVTRTRTVAK